MSEKNATVVVKIGGSFVDDRPALERLARGILKLSLSGSQTVLVHGGGKDIQIEQERRGIAPRFIDGLRCTDDESMRLTEMVLSGVVNKNLVSVLTEAGLSAAGISGRDAGTITAERSRQGGGELGNVGEKPRVCADLLKHLFKGGFSPVLSPVASDENRLPLNVNADHAASAVAVELKADALVFFTDVDGVLKDGEVLNEIRVGEIDDLIATGVIAGGMIPKIRSMGAAIEKGVGRVKVLNGKKTVNLAEDLSAPNAGTTLRV